MRSSILEPAGFFAVMTEGFFFTITDGIYPTRIDTLRNQKFLSRMSTTFAKSNIIIVCSSFVTMSLNFYSLSRISLEELSVLPKSFFGIAIEIVLIKVEMNILKLRGFLKRNQTSFLFPPTIASITTITTITTIASIATSVIIRALSSL